MLIFLILMSLIFLQTVIRNSDFIDLITAVSSIGICCALLILGFSWVDNLYTLANYPKDERYIKSLAHNTQLSDKERQKALDTIDTYNGDILRSRKFEHSLWLGWFYSSDVAELPLFDYRKIPPANKSSKMDLTIGEKYED